jgi:hypothetical protein
MSKKLNAVIGEKLLLEIDRIAKQQQRTRSAMVGLLLAEAVNAREVG